MSSLSAHQSEEEKEANGIRKESIGFLISIIFLKNYVGLIKRGSISFPCLYRLEACPVSHPIT